MYIYVYTDTLSYSTELLPEVTYVHIQTPRDTKVTTLDLRRRAMEPRVQTIALNGALKEGIHDGLSYIVGGLKLSPSKN